MLIYTTITAYDTVNIYFERLVIKQKSLTLAFWILVKKKITTLSTFKSKICFCYIKIKKKNFLESSKIRLNMHARANLSRKITVFSEQYLFYIRRLFTGSVHTSDKIYEFRYNYINILPHFQTVSRHVSGCMSYI